MNELVRDALRLVQNELIGKGVDVRTELATVSRRPAAIVSSCSSCW